MSINKDTFLVRLRKKGGRSQIDVAKSLRITQGTISQWESGSTLLPGQYCEALRMLYNESVEDFYSEYEDYITTFDASKRRVPNRTK